MLLRSPEDVVPNEPVWIRFAAFLDERFPVAGHLALAAVFFTASQAVAHGLEGAGPLQLGTDWILGVGALLLGLFHYRVFDEHKDYEEDLEYNPHRVVQRGVFTLDELKVAAGIAIALEALFTWMIGWPAFTAWLAGFGVSLLLLEEFFLSKGLQKNFVAYGVSHLVGWIPMPFLGYAVATERHFWHAPGLFWLYVAGVFAVVASWEFARKMRVPGQEPRRADAYTEHFGVRGAGQVVLAVQAFGLVVAAAIGAHLGLSPWLFSAPLLVFGVCSIGTLRYLRNPNPERAVALRSWGESYLVGFHLVVAGMLAVNYGVQSPLF